MLQFVEVLSSIRICEYSKYWMLKFHFSTRNAFDQHNLWERALQGRSPASQLNLQGHDIWNRGIVGFYKYEMWGPHCGGRHPALKRQDRLGKEPFAGFGTVVEDITESGYTKNQPILLGFF